MSKLKFFSSDSVICGSIFLPSESFYFNQTSSKYGTTFHLLYKTEMWFQMYAVPLYFTYKMWQFFFNILQLLYNPWMQDVNTSYFASSDKISIFYNRNVDLLNRFLTCSKSILSVFDTFLFAILFVSMATLSC